MIAGRGTDDTFLSGGGIDLLIGGSGNDKYVAKLQSISAGWGATVIGGGSTKAHGDVADYSGSDLTNSAIYVAASTFFAPISILTRTAFASARASR